MSDSKERKVKSLNVVVFGSGSYGTALATVAARKGHAVTMITRRDNVVEGINKENKNPARLSDFTLLKNITATKDIAAALKEVDFIIHAIPAQNTMKFISNIKDLIPVDVPIVSTSKGIYTETLQLMSEVFPTALGRKNQPMAYLSGPSFAKEIMLDHPMAVVVASEDQKLARFIADNLSSLTFRIYLTDDVIGVEVGGALKNPLAIVSGMLAGLGYGQSTRAGMITRGCSHMKKLAVAMGAQAETMAGLAGMGDLMLTASSSLSRNFTVGFRLGKGEKLDDIVESMGEVAEGVPTASVVDKLAAKYKLDLPIFTACKKILSAEMTPEEARVYVMGRPTRKED